jgi:hypothetical protein
MGNAQARQRLRGSDFHYLSKFTAFANNEVRKYAEADVNKYTAVETVSRLVFRPMC